MIIKTLLDTDFYKFTMAQYAYHYYPRVPVQYSFICRNTDVQLADVIDRGRLKEELDDVRSLKLGQDELGYLSSIRIDNMRVFGPDFIDYLARAQLFQYDLQVVADNYRLEFEGNWPEAIFWETLALSIINELYFEELVKRNNISVVEVLQLGLSRLEKKLAALRTVAPEASIIEFGTRRRYSRLWQEIVVDTLKRSRPDQLAGTSNVYLARSYCLTSLGTMAHELDQAMQGIVLRETEGDYNKLVDVHDRVMNEWEQEYSYGLRTNLPDTFGSDWALKRMTAKRMTDWKGERHDSGDPYSFTDKRIERWRDFGIDPQKKLIIYSDGLETDLIVDLYHRYGDQVQLYFGWGTNLTNDVGFKPLSIIVKLTKSCGYDTVKLSDNLAKAVGPPEVISKVKQIFGYESNWSQECKY